jgi:Icc-related predicted phosphoesterase
MLIHLSPAAPTFPQSTNMSTIKTRICMISDTHTSTPHPPQTTNHAYRYPLPKANILLHAGDLTKVGYRVEHEAMIAMLADADAELKLVIAGNHDITLDEEYFTTFGYTRHQRPEQLGDESILLSDDNLQTTLRTSSTKTPNKDSLKSYARSIKSLWTSESARNAGIIYLEEGIHSFTLSTGATFTIYASPYQPEFYNWAFAYPRDQDRYNPAPAALPQPQNPIPDYPAIDILLTHGPPAGVLDQVPPDLNVGCENLLRAARRARPRLHLFGHIHEGWGAQRGVWDDQAGGDGGVRLEDVPTDAEEMLENRGAFYDVSAGAERPLRVGEETLFVNGSIMTVAYEARNAPWVVDLELPVAGG